MFCLIHIAFFSEVKKEYVSLIPPVSQDIKICLTHCFPIVSLKVVSLMDSSVGNVVAY